MYSWLDPQVVASDHYLQHKQAYLNQEFFIIRMIIYFFTWTVFSKKLLGFSRVQNSRTLTEGEHKKWYRWSVSYVVMYALTYSFFSVDLLMSLQPHWYSTIFGVYTFAGSLQALFALVILFILWAKYEGAASMVSQDHFHDLGKFLFGFTILWAYIAFSQYMLIWYANLPEETFFFLDRTAGPWLWVSLSLIIMKFIVPFVGLLPRWAKRMPLHLLVMSVIIVLMQFVDIYWLVYPHYSKAAPVFGLMEFFMFTGFMSLLVFLSRNFLLKNPLRVAYDPHLSESDHHHVTF